MVAVNHPEDINTYQLKEEGEVKMVGPKYIPETGEFLGISETVGFIVIRGSPKEVFFNYGYDREKSKVLYLHCTRRIPSSFSDIIVNRHNTII